jgi:hypothetical protein
MVAAAGTMGVVLWVAQQALFATPPHGVARVMALAALVMVGLVAFGVAALAFGAADWRMFARMPGIGALRRGRT